MKNIIADKDVYGWYAYNTANQSALNQGIFYGRTKPEAIKQCAKATKPNAGR